MKTRILHLVILSLFVSLQFGCDSTATRRTFELRILTYNIHHGEGTDRKFDLPRIAKVIQSVDPDLVALQEVDQGTTRSMGVMQANELGKLTGMHHAYGAAMSFAGGEYGEAILSRFPIISSKNLKLSAPDEYEPRAAIAVQFQPERDLPQMWFVGTHLDHVSDDVRIAQAEQIVRMMTQLPGQTKILAGDMNATPSSPVTSIFRKYFINTTQGQLRPTYPSKNPEVQIDYVFYQDKAGISWRVVETRVLNEPLASDHAPLLVVLQGTYTD